MGTFTKELSIRWSDLDPNFHVRHSVYYDFGAQHRIEILEQLGLTMKVMQEQFFGPILFREECVFRREIRLNSKVFISTKMGKMKDDASRWTIVHELKNENDQLYATISVDGAWIDMKLRKLASPTPQIVADVMSLIPKADDFSKH
ncbi:acyl-CoA thioesterase [Flavobacterium capsici]|uniref:Acyl-CoA thioesterase n=1 Tax=Flavobacterium capsici TaxID=3075618 RepID=A0AA96J763_9FLAO|nr:MULTISPECIES: acyl-CoA thioesterase [unclassified Flavobacterium]WNM19611.1 acyl-CoA thioesterase [Flavobacterium sp. PMR2A8]WNM21001.1 acyl-CoA thioesterase [Flavobacterium sp. PMTSA4]